VTASDLDTELIHRLERDGPIDVFVTYQEYHEHLLPRVAGTWSKLQQWSPTSQRRFLLFLRGYSFYRELSEDENLFWHSLSDELNVPHSGLQNSDYDALEDILTLDSRIADLFIRRHRREFVKTIDAIWGIRSLNAASLEKLFRRYYFTHHTETVTAALIGVLGWDFEPQLLERSQRQARSYDLIFQSLRDAVRLILEHDIPAYPLETLADRVADLGYEFGDPNPIMYFFNKASRALENLLRDLRGEVKQRAPAATEYQIQLEEDVEFITKRRKEHNSVVQVKYQTGTYEYGQEIWLDPVKLTSAVNAVQLSGATERHFSAASGSVSLKQLKPGVTFAQLLAGGEPAAPVQQLQVLPPHEWRFFDHRGEVFRERPVERRTLFAEIRLEDGRFQRVRWNAQWDSSGTQVIAYETQISFDEYDFTAYIACESQGARFYSVEGAALEEISDLSAVRVQVLPTTTTAQHRALLASAPALIANVEALSDLHPLERDELILERNINSAWQCVARIAVATRSTIEQCELRGTMLHLHADAPRDALWRITERDLNGAQVCTHEHPVTREPQQIPCLHPNRFAALSLSVTLESGTTRAERQLTKTADWSALLETELVRGLGWAALRLQTERT
jgi:hypothetical protein